MFIPISNNDSRPLYEQVLDGIKDMIYKGELKPGDMLPSIRELAKDLKMSVITTKRAYFELERQGLIITRAGKGSFVADYSQREIQRAKMEEVYQQIKAIVVNAKKSGLSRQELTDIIDNTIREEF